MTDYYQKLGTSICTFSGLPTCLGNIVLEYCTYNAINYKRWSEECYADEKRKMFITKLCSIPKKYEVLTTNVNSNYYSKEYLFVPEHSSSQPRRLPNWLRTTFFDSWIQTIGDGSLEQTYYYILFDYSPKLFGLLQIRHRSRGHDRDPFLRMVVAETIELIYSYHEVNWWLTPSKDMETKIKITDCNGHGFFSLSYTSFLEREACVPWEKRHLLDKIYYLPKEKRENFIISLKDGTWLAKSSTSTSAQLFYCLSAAVAGSGAANSKPGFVEYQLTQFMELYNK